MRASLRWALGLSLLATIAVVSFTSDGPEPPPTPLIPSTTRARLAQMDRLGVDGTGLSARPVPRPDGGAAPIPARAVDNWPDTLARQAIGAAMRDPFKATMTPVVPVPQVVSQAPPPSPVVALPVVPPMTYRYLGQLTDPDGRRWILVAKGDKEVAVSPGTLLDDGFRVQGIQGNSVALVHVATNTPFEIRIPESDDPTPR